MDRKWWTLIAVCVATFMLLLDITVVNVALPDIQKDLDASLSSLQWVVDAYSLTLAAFLLTAGSFADRIGRRRIFSIGFAVFTFASFLCGISGDATLLNLARGLQGVGGAAMFATSLALIAQEFQGRERGTAIGAWGATIGGAVAIGPLVGGALTEGLGWEWIFFVNVPIGIGAIVLTTTKLANLKAPDPEPIDWPGLATFSLGLFALIFGLIRGNPEGWSSPQIVGSLAAAAVLLVAFFVVEHRQDHAMLDLSLFRKPAFVGVSAVAFGLSAGMFSMFLYITLYIQDVLGYSPLEAGVRFLPLTLLSFFVAPIAGKLSARIPVRVLLGLGLALVGGGLLLMHGIKPRRRLDHPPGGLLGGGRRDRHGQPGDRLDRDRGGLTGEGGHGIGDQQHLPAGGNRDRGGGARGDLPVADLLRALGAGARRAARVRRRRLVGRRPGRDPGGAAGEPRGARHRGQSGVHQRVQRDPDRRRGGRDRRRGARLRAGAISRFRCRARRPARRRAGGRLSQTRDGESVPARC